LNLKEQLEQLKTLQQLLSGNIDEEEPGLLQRDRNTFGNKPIGCIADSLMEFLLMWRLM